MNTVNNLILSALLVATSAMPGFSQTLAADASAAPDSVAADAAPVLPAEQITEQLAEDLIPDIIRSAEGTSLEDWKWLNRLLVVFADSPNDPRYVEQIDLLTERLDALDERDVIVLTDTDPAARSLVRQNLRARGFMLVIIAKDGTIVARKPAPWDVREISRSIDKLALRQQEVRDRTIQHNATR